MLTDSVTSSNSSLNISFNCGDDDSSSVSPMDVFFPIAQFIISVVGLIGNSQICLFYLKKRDKTPSEYIILNLGCVDFIYCLCSVLITGYDKLLEIISDRCDPEQTIQAQSVVMGIYKASQLGLFTFVTNYSYACIFIITINRYFAVCKPITYKIMCTFKVSYTLLIAGESPVTFIHSFVNNFQWNFDKNLQKLFHVNTFSTEVCLIVFFRKSETVYNFSKILFPKYIVLQNLTGRPATSGIFSTLQSC